jgi:beta-glucosidase
MGKKGRLFAGLTSLSASLLCFTIVLTVVAFENADALNDRLHTPTTQIVSDASDGQEDTLYYSSQYGDHTFSDTNFLSLRKDCLNEGILEEEEGAALLYNPKQVLPLASGSAVTLLGHASVDPVFKGNSAGNKVSAKSPDVVTLAASLTADGFRVNPDLLSALEAGSAHRGTIGTVGGAAIPNGSAKGSEEPLSFYENQVSTFATDYQDACIITLAREASEGTDMLMDDDDDDTGSSAKISSLALHQNEKDLLSFARSHFTKVIVLLNSPYPLEVEGIQEKADAIVAIGQPGLTGFQGVSHLLCGKANPSGRLVDTYATSSLSAPAVVNSGTRTPLFLNADSIKKQLGTNERAQWMSFQAENIYLGYKYYETRYEDSVLNRNQANATAGSLDGLSWDYAKEVSYPFGYGLSYTTFTESLKDVSVAKDQITVNVTVTNTGTVIGKHTVELYAQTPYGDYEKAHGVEKSAIQLVGFGKTPLLAPQETVALTMTVDPYLLASYDANGVKGYLLSGGNYYLALGNNAHEALNAILEKKQATGLRDENGQSVSADSANVYSFSLAQDQDSYRKSTVGTQVTNRFESCDLNTWIPASGTYLSRSAWETTYPGKQTQVTATADMITALSGKTYTMPNDAKKASATALGQKKGLTLAQMRKVDYASPLWDDFLKQMTLEELSLTTVESFSCPGIETIAQPDFTVGDGIDSNGGSFTLSDKTAIPLMTYPSKPILTGSFNKELYAQRGTLMGEEAMFTKYMENYNEGLDLHRTPFGGRNFEYMSEDAILSYLASIPETQAMEAKGTHAAPKHFCGNDQEYHREGVCTFFNEQAFRENSLKAFEGALKVAHAGGVMQSFERQGCTWASASKALNTTLLREEWGYQGNVITDATDGVSSGYKSHVIECLDSGTEQFCLDYYRTGASLIVKQIKETDDGNLLTHLLQAAKDWEFALSRTTVINGLSSHSHIVAVTPWWKTMLIVVVVSLAVISFVLLGLTCHFLKADKPLKKAD